MHTKSPLHSHCVWISKFKPMGLLQLFAAPSIPNQNPQGQRQNSKDPWVGCDSSRNAPDETQKSRHHTSLYANDGHLAKDAQFGINFGIQVDTHAKIRKWVSKVMCFTVAVRFSKQNAQDIAKFKTKRMADLHEFGSHFDHFAAHISRKKSLKTRARGTS